MERETFDRRWPPKQAGFSNRRGLELHKTTGGENTPFFWGKKTPTNGVWLGGVPNRLGDEHLLAILKMKFYILKVSDGRGGFWKKNYMSWDEGETFCFSSC